MKSYINDLVDFKTFDFPHEVQLSCPDDHIQKQLKHITRGHKETIEVSQLQKGDIAVIDLESSLERFNRSDLTLAVGSGLFDKELEAALIGKNTGDEFTVTVKETPVKVTVRSGKRTVFPEPTDEMAKQYAESIEGMEDVETVAQYIDHIKAQYIDEQKQSTVFTTLDEMLQYVLTNSDWEFDEDELEEMYKAVLEDMEQMAQETCGKSFDEMTDEDISVQTGLPDKETLLTELHNQCERQIASLLFVAVNNGKDPKALSIEEAYGLSWDFMQNYVEENISFTVE